MNHRETFKGFFDSIRMESADFYFDGLHGVTKKLNQRYYESSSETEHCLIVGSVGRGTAVDGTSDLDVLFELPSSVRGRFDDHQGNGQSDLLQEIKGVLKERYPNSEIKGDGQAVVIDFTDRNYTIELVPAFRQSDDSFLFPNSHDGGSWKKTDPIPEQEACAEADLASDGRFIRYCNALRVWKSAVGACLGGLLVDTLVDKYLGSNDDLDNASVADSYSALTCLFEQISKENPEQSYWHALGSNQQIDNKDKGAFVSKAKHACNLLSSAEDEADRESALAELFGKTFQDCVVDGDVKTQEYRWSARYGYSPAEQFIEDNYPIAIRYNLKIDCEITQDGFQPATLRTFLTRHFPLKRDKQLRFYVASTNAREPYSVYWKVRNCGEIAFKKKMVRGTILKDEGKHERREHTDFTGNHFVECYVVKDGVCIARDRIIVPIKTD